MVAPGSGSFDAAVELPAFVQRAARALLELEGTLDPAEPLRLAVHRAIHGLGATPPVAPLLDFLEHRAPGSPRGDSRYRWELSHRVGVKHPRYAPSEHSWTAWRRGEEHRLDHDPFALETRLLLPIILCENLEVLLEAAAGDEPTASRARALVDEAAPVIRRDVARYITATDAWEDTFALWCIARAPRTLDLLHSLAVALGVTYAAGQQGPIRGNRFPYYEKPLVSANAQLASALLGLGIDLDVATAAVRFVGDHRLPSGAWSDDPARDDPLTTVIAADLLARTDPSLDLGPTLGYFEATQRDDGLWRALGPDAPWLTAQVIALAVAHRQSFAARFRWPHCGRALQDHKTGVPFFAHFIDVANLFASVPGLASSPIELAFIDLIGFRAFNNRHGQDAGDDVLRGFATHLKTIPTARAVRDGGDEFLVIGAPCRGPITTDLEAFMTSWQACFHARFGAETRPVLPRIVVGQSAGGDLRALRQRLGREITALKELPQVPDIGVLVESRG